MKRKYLYVVAALLWGIPGVEIFIKGIKAYAVQPSSDLWWLLLCTAAVLAGFFFMFRKIVRKYSDMIASQPEKTSIFHTFPLRGWLMLAFFMCLGITIKHIPAIPSAFIASFYCGLGPMLMFSAYMFLRNSR